ncbi:MAG: type III-B CRISPR module RAMP protein Cmr6 [Victivallales bacterium]|nr:type III-B CRISPR module RAMP protein Cmr6 [Victivallales bacterium]
MRTATDAIANLLGDKFEKCESPSLRLEKFVNVTKNAQDERKNEIDAFVNCHHKFVKKNAPTFRHPLAKEFIAMLGGNLIVNQSGGVLENAGLCLDSIRNYPYIPGSAVKGVASHAAWAEWEEDKSLEKALQVARVFGFPTNHKDLDRLILNSIGQKNAQGCSGAVCFMAAVPFENAAISVDIATSHHPEYYQGGRNKAFDDENPIPLPFPVVKAGTKFIFRLLPLKNCNDTIMADAQKWLIQAMTVLGLGAKTAAGYGWFEYDEAESQKLLKIEKEKAEQKRLAEEKLERERLAREKAKQEEMERAKAKKEYEEKIKTMSPEEKWDYIIANEWDENKFRNRLGMFWQTGKGALDEEEKKAIVRALKVSKKAVWDEIKNAKQKKGEPPWPRIADEVRKLNKTTYGDKMP